MLALLALWAFITCLGAALLALAKQSEGGASADAAVDKLNALMPQLQCGLCGYPGCKPYAQALLAGSATVDLCPPGGASLAEKLARLLGQEQIAHQPAAFDTELVARIDEAACIGCFRCVQVCPTDAIVGAPKRLHSVLSSDCTGCQLCLPVCPVDCINLETSD